MEYNYLEEGKMETRENQKVVTTMKALHDSNNLYSPVNIEAASKAMSLLKPNTFKIWFYLGKNQDQYTFVLSKIDVMKFCNISRSTYLSSIKELIDTHYLVPDKDGSNHYNFYEFPQEVEDDLIITINKG